MNFLDVKTDYAFKKVFGSENSKDILISFLNAIIYCENSIKIKDLTIVDPYNVIQHVSVNSLNVGRNPKETLRILDALQSDELCPCNRQSGGDTIDASAEAAKIAA